MTNLFSRLYLTFTATLVALLTIIGAALYGYGHFKLQRYATVRVDPVVELAKAAWLSLDVDEHSNWLALMSTLSGTQWQLQETADPRTLLSVNPLKKTVSVQIPLDSNQVITIPVENWDDWHKAHGWLILGALSNVPADLREAKFQALVAQTPWPLTRVNRDNEALNALFLRQLSNGQSIRVTDVEAGTDTFYYPAGARQLIRMGPIPTFQLFTPEQWVSLFVFSLMLLSLAFSLWVRPIQRRFTELLTAVDHIDEQSDSVRLPTDHNDNVGQLAKHIERMAHRLIEQVRLNRQLNQAVSHDLKTPLARIQFALALLPDADENPYVEQIRTDVTLLSNLTQELLLYHQLKQSSPDEVQCWAVVELTHSLANVPEGAHLDVVHPQQDRQIPMLATHWRRITDNLIKNAVQYGHGKLKVNLSFQGNSLALRVHDNGKGLSDEQFEALKQPFQRQQAHRNLNENNHGLGLAIVDATVSHYGGDFSVCTSPLGGSCFCVHLHFTNNVGLE